MAKEGQMTKKVVALLLIGFALGICLGVFFSKSYINNYTMECVKAFDTCKDKYNALVIPETKLESPGYPFNVSFNITEGGG